MSHGYLVQADCRPTYSKVLPCIDHFSLVLHPIGSKPDVHYRQNLTNAKVYLRIHSHALMWYEWFKTGRMIGFVNQLIGCFFEKKSHAVITRCQSFHRNV